MQTGSNDTHPGKPAEAGPSRHRGRKGACGLRRRREGGCPAHSAQAEIHIACGSRGVCGSSQGTSVSAGSERTRPHKRTALRSSSAPHTLNPPVSSCRGAARAREGDPKRHVHAWALRGTGARPRSTGAPAETQPCLASFVALSPGTQDTLSPSPQPPALLSRALAEGETTRLAGRGVRISGFGKTSA